jgi:uncharacterized membrane protein
MPAFLLASAALCSWAIAHGASMRWRLLFRVLCHGKPERCLELFGIAMPLCARCTGFYGGVLAGLLFVRAIPWLRERVMRIVVLAALLPLAIDGLTQLAGFRESTNSLRLITGVVAGFAFGLWILSAIGRGRDRVFTTS